MISIRATDFVRCREVVLLSEGPLWEVRLYIMCLQDRASPLFIASQQGHCDVVDMLLKNRANINQAMQVWNMQSMHITACT